LQTNLDRETALPVPAYLAEVTAEWLQRALSPVFPGLVVESVVSERLGEGYGLTSQIFRYRWETGAPPRSVVVKLWPTDGPGGTREVLFYRTFGQVEGARIPACFHADYDDRSRRGVLVLEDQGPIVQGDCLLELSLDQALGVAGGLAAIHAAWLSHATLQEIDWLPSIARWEKKPGWFASRRKTFLERYGERLNEPARSLLDEIEADQVVANDRLAGAAITLLHADLHLDNLVFVEGAEPVFLDWARCAKEPLALDLYDLLFPMIPDADRQRVLEAYLEAFAARAGVEPEVENLWHQLGGVFLRKFASATCGFARWQPASPREMAMIEVGLRRALHELDYWHAHDPELFGVL
jgi:hypothetical protein